MGSWVLCLSVVLAGACATGGLTPPQVPFLSKKTDELALGERLYVGHCAYCHGIGGTGGTGPSLAVARLRRATNERKLVEIIRRGIPGTEMPRVRRMTEREYSRLAGYVRSLGRVAQEPLAGDATRGMELYHGKGGCGVCHIIAGEGGSLGPELTDVGARRSASHLRESLVRGGSTVREDYRVVRVVPRDGPAVRGLRVNEDSFTIQVRDANDRFYSFRKLDLAAYRHEIGATLMPDYRSELSASEIDDLVAYMAGLRAEP